MAQTQRMFAGADTNRDGMVSKNEFCMFLAAWVGEAKKGRAAREARRAGTEPPKPSTPKGAKNLTPLQANVLTRIFESVDLDNSGELDEVEVAELLPVMRNTMGLDVGYGSAQGASASSPWLDRGRL